MLSVVVPVYNEEKNIVALFEAVRAVLLPKGISFEMVYVNDGSKDGSFREIEKLSKSVKDVSVKGISFSRNFGKEAAIFTGLSYAAGDVCVVMDCDLQHPPETLLEMYAMWEQGFEIIEGVKRSRGKENVFYKAFAKLFYKLISYSTGIEMYRSSDFKMLDRKVVNEYIKLQERNIFFRALSSWLGFRSTVVEFDVRERLSGKTKWSIKSLVKYAIGSITSFTTAPMQFITLSGFLFLLFALVLGVQSVIKWSTGHALEGFTTVILLLLMTGSMIMISLGIIGYYLARIYEEIKGRPRSIIEEIVSNQEMIQKETEGKNSKKKKNKKNEKRG